jgi:hypothetical protein
MGAGIFHPAIEQSPAHTVEMNGQYIFEKLNNTI